jgi:hypothetical protein
LAAAGDAEGPAALVAAAEVAKFLKCHAGRRLVCRGAGPWHATLPEDARPDAEVSAALWAFSGNSRLADVEALNAALRRRDMGFAGVAPDGDARRQVVAAARGPGGRDGGALSLAVAVAQATLAASRSLRGRAIAATADDNLDRFTRTRRLAGASDLLTEGVAEAADSVALWGLLGTDGDALRSVAAWSAGRHPPAVDAGA